MYLARSGRTVSAAVQSNEIAAGLRQFIEESFMLSFERDAGPDTDLFEKKYIDSFGFVDLVTFIERRFNIKLAEDDLAEPAMGTLNGMRAIIERRIAERAVP